MPTKLKDTLQSWSEYNLFFGYICSHPSQSLFLELQICQKLPLQLLFMYSAWWFGYWKWKYIAGWKLIVICHGPVKHSPSFMHNYLRKTLHCLGEWLLFEFMHVYGLQPVCMFIYVCFLLDIFFAKKRCWRIFMIKLWNHNLLDARSMNTCNMIIDNFKN